VTTASVVAGRAGGGGGGAVSDNEKVIEASATAVPVKVEAAVGTMPGAV